VFKPEYLADEELEGTNVPTIQADVDGVSDIPGDYPGSESFLPSDIFQEILKQEPPKLDEITICHPTQATWQKMKSRVMPKKWSKERNWFMADPPEPRCKLSDLTEMQLHAYKSITQKREKLLYIIGKAGSGKTELALHVCKFFKGKVQAGAGTAKAALLFRGPNAHAMFGWGVSEHSETFSSPEGRKKLKELQKFYGDREIFIFDEINAMSASMVGTLDFTLQKIYGNSLPFGGKLVMCLGDPAQLRPVKGAAIYDSSIPPSTNVGKYNRKNIASDSSYFTRSKMGQQVYRYLEDHCIILKQGKRQHGLAQVLMDKVRDGEQTIEDLIKLRHQAIKFPDFEKDYGIHYNNDSCLMYNLKTLWSNASKSDKRVFVCPATYHEDVSNDQPSLSTLRSVPAQNYHFAADVLCLAEGAEVRLVENFNTQAGLVNSVTGIVQKIIYDARDVDAILEGKFPSPSCVIIEFESFTGFPQPDGTKYYPYPGNKKLVGFSQRDFECKILLPKSVRFKYSRSKCTRSQFPIDLSRHITCHRAQGQSWDNYNIGIDLELASAASSIPNDVSSILYVAGTRSSNLRNIFLEAIHPDIWLKIGNSASDKARRAVEKRLLQKSEEFARQKGFYNLFVDEENAAQRLRPSQAELDAEWKQLQDCKVPPPSKGKPIIMDVDCPISSLPGVLRPVNGERHIGIDQGEYAFAICVIDKFRGRVPILQAADLHNFKDDLRLNFTAADLMVVLQNKTRLLTVYMDLSKQPTDPNARKIDRVVVHLEQMSIENAHFEEYTTELGQALQSRAPDLSKVIVKLSSSKVHRVS
jgi:hypothetical protein